MSYVKRILRELPELWALHQNWVTDFPEVKIHRAPAVRFLMEPLRPSAGMTRVTPYVVTDWPTVERLAETYRGEPIIEESTRDLDLQSALIVELGMRGDRIPYVFLLEDMGEHGRGRIIVVKPPAGQKNFGGYLEYLRRKRN